MAADEKKVLKDQLELMANRLLEEGKKIKTEDIVIMYDNGGGQSGIRENPFYPAYEKLLAAYTKTLTVYKDIVGNADADIRSLESIRSRFKVAK